ncbi:hypothetical protein [Actinoplanes friuliensis]|uniref:hypothetical protein n=1 Tax=Actinoplanes friuliensis TaxID=196914 RepID=UPI0005A18238|nr:hypothetical protein [Actinoplanes friuliensis]
MRKQTAAVGAVAVAVLAIAAPLAFAGDDKPDPVPAAALPPVPSVAPPDPAPSPVPSAARKAVAPDRAADAPKGMPDQYGCPATADQLLDGLRDSDLAPARALDGIECYRGYARADREPAGTTVVFRWQEMTASWVPLAGRCHQVVPAAVRDHLNGCS